MRTRGFSLIELLVVLGIIALLASLGIANYSAVKRRALESAAQTHGSSVTQAIANYFAINLTTSTRSFMDLPAVASLPPANWSGAPAAARSGQNGKDRSCTRAATLPGGYSWPDAPKSVKCVLGLRTQGGLSQIKVFTWVEGSDRYYVNGQAR